MPKVRPHDEKRRVPASALSFDPDALDEILATPIEKTLYEALTSPKPRSGKGYNRRQGATPHE